MMSSIGAVRTQIQTNIQQPQIQSSPQQPNIADKVEQNIFGFPTPNLVDPAGFPELSELLNILMNYRTKITHFAGEPDNTYCFRLAEGIAAAVNQDCIIFLGVGFLSQYKNSIPLLVGAIAHEIGHQPKKLRKKEKIALAALKGQYTIERINAICREEEALADHFAGLALAELELSPEPLIHFLAQNQTPHPRYLDAEARGEIILAAYQQQSRRGQILRKHFPKYAQSRDSRLYLGES
jgi:hypothetical protein